MNIWIFLDMLMAQNLINVEWLCQLETDCGYIADEAIWLGNSVWKYRVMGVSALYIEYLICLKSF